MAAGFRDLLDWLLGWRSSGEVVVVTVSIGPEARAAGEISPSARAGETMMPEARAGKLMVPKVTGATEL